MVSDIAKLRYRLRKIMDSQDGDSLHSTLAHSDMHNAILHLQKELCSIDDYHNYYLRVVFHDFNNDWGFASVSLPLDEDGSTNPKFIVDPTQLRNQHGEMSWVAKPVSGKEVLMRIHRVLFNQGDQCLIEFLGQDGIETMWINRDAPIKNPFA